MGAWEGHIMDTYITDTSTVQSINNRILHAIKWTGLVIVGYSILKFRNQISHDRQLFVNPNLGGGETLESFFHLIKRVNFPTF